MWLCGFVIVRTGKCSINRRFSVNNVLNCSGVNSRADIVRVFLFERFIATVPNLRMYVCAKCINVIQLIRKCICWKCINLSLLIDDRVFCQKKNRVQLIILFFIKLANNKMEDAWEYGISIYIFVLAYMISLITWIWNCFNMYINVRNKVFSCYLFILNYFLNS